MGELNFSRKLIELGDNEGAIEELENFIRITPNDIEGWLLLAEAFQSADEKIKCYCQVLRLDNNNLKAQQYLNVNASHRKSDSVPKPGTTNLINVPHLISPEVSVRENNAYRPPAKKVSQKAKKGNKLLFFRVSFLLAGILSVSIFLLFLLISPSQISYKNINSSGQNVPIEGKSVSFIPVESELPQGFKVIDGSKGSLELQSGEGYKTLYANDSFENDDRERNLLYVSSVFSNGDDASIIFETLSDESSFAEKDDQVIRKSINPKKINADQSKLFFFIHKPVNSNQKIVNGGLTFRIVNFIGVVIVKGEVQNDENMVEMQNRLEESAYYYAYLMIRKLPLQDYKIVEVSFPEYSPKNND